MENKTIEQLENDIWKEPEYDTYLIKRCHQLRKKRLADFEVEDIRIMIGQNIGLIYLVPKSIDLLKDNLFASGDLFEGDLLQNLLKIDQNFWKTHPQLRKNVTELIKDKGDLLRSYHIKWKKFGWDIS